MLLIEIVCAADEADALVQAMRSAKVAPVEIRAVEVAPAQLEGRNVREQVTGRLARTALRALIDEAALDEVAAALAGVRLQHKAKWFVFPVIQAGEIG